MKALDPVRPIQLQPYAGPEHRPFVLGDGSAGVLLVHGFPGTPAEMRPIAEDLAGCGWTAHGLLLPGFGPDIMTLEQRRRTDWIAAAQHAYQALFQAHQPVCLVGYSMGAALALQLAAQRTPDRLVLIAPFWRLPGWLPALAPLARRFLPRMRPFQKADFNDPRLRQMFDRILPGVDLDDAQIQQTIRQEFTLPVAAVDEILRLGKESYRLAENVHTQVLVIQGAQDPLVRPVFTQRLVERMRHSQVDLRVLPGDHELIAQGAASQPAVIRIVLDYLKMGCR